LDTDLIPQDECLIFEAFWSDILKSFTSNSSKNFSIYARIANIKKNPIFSVLSEFKLFLLCKEFLSLEFEHNQEINFTKVNINNYDDVRLRKINSSNYKNTNLLVSNRNYFINNQIGNNIISNNYVISTQREKSKLDNYIKITNVNTYNSNNFNITYNLDSKRYSDIKSGVNSSNNINIPTGINGSNVKEKTGKQSYFENSNFDDLDNILISKLFIIYEGKIKFYKNDIFIKELETNGIFGDISFGINLNFNNGDIAYAEGQVKCYCIDAKILRENVDENYFNYIQSILVLQDTSINIEDLFFVKSIGNGKYGKVCLVHNRKNLYALKTAKLSDIKKELYLVNYYMNEKILMQQIDHPFIVKLVKTMKNKEMIFFLMEFIDGHTLKFYLDKRPKNHNKNIEEAQFLGAILLIIINYLHKKRIIHRDIKPDNIMVDQSVNIYLCNY